MKDKNVGKNLFLPWADMISMHYLYIFNLK